MESSKSPHAESVRHGKGIGADARECKERLGVANCVSGLEYRSMQSLENKCEQEL